MKLRICWVLAIVAFALVPGHPRAANLTALVSFCALANCADGMTPQGGVIADAHGNLFGTTGCGGAHNGGTVFEIRKTRRGYASTPTILVSFDKPLPPFAIPATLQDSLAARLDRLAPVKAIAQIDAAIGREFSYPLLRAVAGATSRHCARHWRSSRRRSCCSARACRPMRATPSSMRWSRTPRTKPCSGAGGRSCKQPKQSGPAWRETPPQF